MAELEKDVEQKLRKMIEKHGGHCLKWVCPGWSGVPDRIILLPGARVLFVETKRPKGGKLEKLQDVMNKYLWDFQRVHQSYLVNMDRIFLAFRVNDEAGIHALELCILDLTSK